MNSIIAYLKLDLVQKRYTDVKIKFDDGTKILELDAHRNIIAAVSPVLDRLFQFNLATEYTIKVNFSADSALDILREAYGIKPNIDDWSNILNHIVGKDFFGMPIDITILYQLIVPAEGFDLFLEAIEIILGWVRTVQDHCLIRCIQQNLPPNHAVPQLLFEEFSRPKYIILSKFSENLIFSDAYVNRQIRGVAIPTFHMSHSLIFKDAQCIFSPDFSLIVPFQKSKNCQKIYIFNVKQISNAIISGILLDNLLDDAIIISIYPPMSYPTICSIAITPNNKNIICVIEKPGRMYGVFCFYIHVYDISTKKSLLYFEIDSKFVYNITVTPDSKTILWGCIYDKKYYIEFFDIESKCSIKRVTNKCPAIAYNEYPINASFSPNGKYLVICGSAGDFKWTQIFEITESISITLDNCIFKQKNFDCFAFDPTSKYIAGIDSNQIIIYDFILKSQLKTFNLPKTIKTIKNIRFSSDNKSILINSIDDFYQFDIATEKIITHFVDCNLILDFIEY